MNAATEISHNTQQPAALQDDGYFDEVTQEALDLVQRLGVPGALARAQQKAVRFGTLNSPLKGYYEDVAESIADAFEAELASQPADPDACPGCGCKPGDGYTAECEHPAGCGYFKAMAGNFQTFADELMQELPAATEI